MQPTVFDVDTFICSRLVSKPGKVARHKLAYAVHRLAILTTGEPIFDSFCAALPLGPCFIDLLHHPDRVGNPDALLPEHKQMVQAVLEKLGAMSGKALAVRSHRNYYEWRIMREGMNDNQVKANGKYRQIPVTLIRMLPEIQSRGARVGEPLLT